MIRPLMLLDVDGPLNPHRAATPPTSGYQSFHLDGDSFTDPEGRPWQGGLRVWLDPAHGQMLRALAEMADLVWATAWEHLANKLVAPVLGLPELPVIHFPHRNSYPLNQIFKRPEVEAFVGDRPFGWFDDDFQLGDYEWAAERTRAGRPTCLRWIDPAVGLTQRDVDLLAEWLDDPFGLRVLEHDGAGRD